VLAGHKNIRHFKLRYLAPDVFIELTPEMPRIGLRTGIRRPIITAMLVLAYQLAAIAAAAFPHVDYKGFHLFFNPGTVFQSAFRVIIPLKGFRVFLPPFLHFTLSYFLDFNQKAVVAWPQQFLDCGQPEKSGYWNRPYRCRQLSGRFSRHGPVIRAGLYPFRNISPPNTTPLSLYILTISPCLIPFPGIRRIYPDRLIR